MMLKLHVVNCQAHPPWASPSCNHLWCSQLWWRVCLRGMWPTLWRASRWWFWKISKATSPPPPLSKFVAPFLCSGPRFPTSSTSPLPALHPPLLRTQPSTITSSSSWRLTRYLVPLPHSLFASLRSLPVSFFLKRPCMQTSQQVGFRCTDECSTSHASACRVRHILLISSTMQRSTPCVAMTHGQLSVLFMLVQPPRYAADSEVTIAACCDCHAVMLLYVVGCGGCESGEPTRL